MQDDNLFSPEPLADLLWNHGQLFSHIIQGKEKAAAKFSYYADYTKALRLISPAHALDLMRGRKIGCLRVSFKLQEEAISRFPDEISQLSTLTRADKAKLDKAVFSRLREIAEKEAIALCVQHLREHLMAPPIGKKAIMSLDTFLRGGVKIAIIDGEGKLLDTTILHLYPPLKDWYGSLAELAKLAIKYNIEIIAIGVGAAYRESTRLIHDLMKMYPDLKLFKRVVYTPAAPTYSNVELIDEPFWSAVSIGRQLQDPLAELAKIDPITLNIGPYKEDVRAEILKPALENLIKDCVELVNNSLDDDPRNSMKKRSTNQKHARSEQKNNKNISHTKPHSTSNNLFNSAMADAFAKLKMGEK